MGHSGRGPYGSSDSPTWEGSLRIPTSYEPEIWTIRKDTVYAAVAALQAALGYMSQVKSEVPQWQRQRDIDVRNMEQTLEALKKLNGKESHE